MDSLRAMELFIRSVNSGSFSAAGRDAGMSPAAVSRLISGLEDRLGAKLLNRTSRSMSLTEAGEIYMRQAEVILQQVSQAEVSVSDLSSTPSGTLRVHSWTFVGSQFIAPLIPAFLKLYPGISVKLMLSNTHVDLAEHNIDVDIRLGALQDSDLMVRKLGETQRYVVASPAYLETMPPIRLPEDLKQHNCLTYALNRSGSNWSFVDRHGEMTTVAVSGNFQTDYGPALWNAALADMGIVLMPEWSVRKDIQEGRLVQVLKDFTASHVSFDPGIYAIFQRHKHITLKTRLFIDFLARSFQAPDRGSA